MAEETRIEWADHTFNPWIGCTKVSPACDHCYAEAQADRYWKAEGLWQGNRKRTSANNWRQPLKWNRDAAAFRERTGEAPMVFCASLADVFDNQVPDEWRRDLWELINVTPKLIWLLLTKRPQNIRKMLPPSWLEPSPYGWHNVWLGTTVENQEEADRRIPHLLAAPAAKRFLSCEPLLGPVDLSTHRPCDQCHQTPYEIFKGDPLCETPSAHWPSEFCPLCWWPNAGCDGTLRSGIDWVIAGGESGREARPSHPDWFRALRDQCAAADVPFLFKQWGEWREGMAIIDQPRGGYEHVHFENGAIVARVGKKAAGRALDGVIHDARPGTAP
jgi:protein gp37